MTPKEVSEAANKIILFVDSLKITNEGALHAILNAGSKILASNCYHFGMDPKVFATLYTAGFESRRVHHLSI